MEQRIDSTRTYRAGYKVHRGWWRIPGVPEDWVSMRWAENLEGDYIGTPREAFYLCRTKGIRPEKIDYRAKVCSIGFCEQEQKWYGWSHRAMYGFGVGDEVKKGDGAAESLPVGFVAKTLDDAKRIATAFARSVS